MSKTPSLSKARYFVFFTNDFSWKSFIYTLRKKIKCFSKFKNHLWVFGYDAYTHKQSQTKTKLNPKSTKCIFVKYNQNDAKAYKLTNLETLKPIINRNVVFNEEA
jgi:hypothetical protein